MTEAHCDVLFFRPVQDSRHRPLGAKQPNRSGVSRLSDEMPPRPGGDALASNRFERRSNSVKKEHESAHKANRQNPAEVQSRPPPIVSQFETRFFDRAEPDRLRRASPNAKKPHSIRTRASLPALAWFSVITGSHYRSARFLRIGPAKW